MLRRACRGVELAVAGFHSSVKAVLFAAELRSEGWGSGIAAVGDPHLEGSAYSEGLIHSCGVCCLVPKNTGPFLKQGRHGPPFI